jgi:uncharacterized protein (TIGR02145 family)
MDAGFTSDIKMGIAPLTVNFKNVSAGEFSGWEWNFDDGHTSNEKDPSHTFQTPGAYTVILKITNNDKEDIETTTITVSNEINPEIVMLTKTSLDVSIESGQNVIVYGTNAANYVRLESGAKAEMINFPGQNSIQVQSSSDLFTVSRSGTMVTFQGSDETILKIPATTDVQTISFNGEGSRVLQIHNNQVVLDDQVITTTPASIEKQVEQVVCGAYVVPNVWKEFDCYNLAAIGKTTNDDPFTPSWRLIGGYWQWGRKGPDSSQWYDTSTEHFAHGPAGPGESEANDGEISNWDDDYASDGAWSDSYKTANDPCPAGFRVPTESQWAGVIGNNTQSTVGTWSTTLNDHTNYSSARFFGNDLMLPATGNRNYDSGSLYNRGNSGYYWSSSQYTSDFAWNLNFSSSNVNTSYNSLRRLGFSVRCVAEDSSLPSTVSGTVWYALQTVSGIKVELRAGEMIVQTVYSDEDGSYCFENVNSGEYGLRVYGPTEEYVGWSEYSIQVSDSDVIRDLSIKKDITLISPENKALITSKRPTLIWETNADATRYVVQVNISSTWELVIHDTEVPTNSYTFSEDLLSSKTYTWQIDAYNEIRSVGGTMQSYQFTVD